MARDMIPDLQGSMIMAWDTQKGREKSLENMAACCSRSLWYPLLVSKLSYLLQLNRPERELPKG